MDMGINTLIVMIVISIISGLLSTMNLWVDSFGDMRSHLNDSYMIILMTAWMVVFDSLYNARAYYFALFSLIVVVFTVYMIRKQLFIDDKQFLSGMIPHHSMAIHMAKRIKEKSKNLNIIQLANNIIHSQTKEIELMKELEKTLL